MVSRHPRSVTVVGGLHNMILISSDSMFDIDARIYLNPILIYTGQKHFELHEGLKKQILTHSTVESVKARYIKYHSFYKTSWSVTRSLMKVNIEYCAEVRMTRRILLDKSHGVAGQCQYTTCILYNTIICMCWCDGVVGLSQPRK